MLSNQKDTLLIIGDTEKARTELRDIFRDSYSLLEAENIEQAVLLLEQNSSCIALVLMDMPKINRKEMRRLNAATLMGSNREIPLIAVVSYETNGTSEEHAFLMGATDVILKPFSPLAVQRRVQIMVDFFLHKWSLEKMVEEQSETIRNSNQVMLDALSAIIEHRSTESGNHVLRIRRFTQILLKEVANCCPEYELTDTVIDVIASASALHDIGKISVPDAILNKPGKLTSEEFEVMKSHTTVGSRLVKQLAGMGEELYLRYAYNISLYHHERWGGKGYPCGLVGDEIPICAQVVGLTDAFDALTTKRVYKPAYPYQSAVNMILNGECGEFSPKLLECFKHVRNKLVELARNYADGYSPKNDNISVPLPGPVMKSGEQNTLQMFQAKYQALLHYIDDTVLELDIDNGIYHVVYNPNPELKAIVPNASFDDILERMSKLQLHPDDVGVIDDIRCFVSYDLFRLNQRRRTFFFRVLRPVERDYQSYEVAFLRINTGDAGQRIVTAIWRKLGTAIREKEPIRYTDLHSSPALFGLVSSALRCCDDRELTIDAGAQNLFALTGYTEDEIRGEFDNRLINLIHPADRKCFYELMDETIKTGGKIETEFRVFCKNSDPLWVLAKSRIYMEQNGREYFYFAIRDNSQSRAVHQKLLSDIERNQILIDQAGSIIFDWDMGSDTMYCSPKWVEHFGYVPVSKNYGAQMGIATHFHPDDLIMVRSGIGEIKHGKPTITMDVRIANIEGKYLWTRITAIGRRGEDGELRRIIGVIRDIDELKRATIVLKEQAQRDSLTKLLNKASTQEFAEDYLQERDRDTLAAMLVIDLDNFKSVNDAYGHLYGDVVLTQTSSVLKKLFRSHDIIGRIGGDEFLVVLKDIPSREIVVDRCELLRSSLKSLFDNVVPELEVSCTIGAALVPEHGILYGELFRKADEALYIAKSAGKNQYRIYSRQDQYTYVADNASHTTRIDSDDPAAVTSNSFERFVFRSLYESRNVDRTVQELLEFIGTHFNVSRAYVFENNDDNTTCSNTFEWCNDGITPEKDALQNVSYITDIPGWPEVYDERGVFYCADITQLDPQFRAILEPQNIKSMLQCAITDQGVFRGYIGFDECFSNRLWTQEQISQLEFMAQVLAVFLIKRQKENQN